jgi:hypothetical protein
MLFLTLMHSVSLLDEAAINETNNGIQVDWCEEASVGSFFG